MPHQVIELECPGCAASISTSTKTCPYCYKPIVISTFNSVHAMPPLEINKRANVYRKALANHPDNQELNMSVAFCYLKLKLYDKALPCFEKAIEDNFDNSEVYFYAAICLLRGKKAFLATREDIDRALEYLDAAAMIEAKGVYYYFMAYIKYDYFERKYLNTSPNYAECLQNARDAEVSVHDKQELFGILGVEKPCLF